MSSRDQLLDVRIERDGETAFVALAGELDLGSADKLARECSGLRDGGLRNIVLDLQGLRFIDSSGVHALVGVHRQAATRGVKVLLGPASDAVRRVLSIAGVERLLEPAPPGLRPQRFGRGPSDR